MEIKKTEIIEAKIYECDDVEGDYLRVEYNHGSHLADFKTSSAIQLDMGQIKTLADFLYGLSVKNN